MVAKTGVRMLFLKNEHWFCNQYTQKPLVWYWYTYIFKVLSFDLHRLLMEAKTEVRMLFSWNDNYFLNHHTQKPMVWYTYVYILFFQVQPLNCPPNRSWSDLNCIKGKHCRFSKVISSMFKSDRIGISTIFFPQRRPLFYPKKELSLFRGQRRPF